VSNISTVIDALRTQIAIISGFPGKTEIPNAYSLKDNPETMLENGWGIRIGPASPSTIDEYSKYSESRVFTVVLTKLIFRTEEDIAAFSTAAKALLEDALLIKKLLDGPLQFNTQNYVVMVDFERDSGLSFIKDDKFSLLYNEMSFTVDISENW
jgi:hypothetical protein